MEDTVKKPLKKKGTPDALDGILFDLSAEKKNGRKISDVERVTAFRKLVSGGFMPTFVPLLPLLLNLDGQPYHLDDHFPFEALFRTRLPRKTLLKTARQVSKSTSLASKFLIVANAISHFNILFVTPLYEQIRRFSTNYVRKFIEQSPLKELWMGTGTENSVLQRSFKNYSKMFFSFALTDADRVRGISAHANSFDEIQDMDQNLLPVIEETMSASKWRIVMYAGTPKTLENTIEGKWLSCSRAEWCIPCPNCGKDNIPRMGYDLEKMIGPWHEGIGPMKLTQLQKDKDVKLGVPATICARCQHWVNPADGFWWHEKPEKRWTFPGYHVPQIIMPMHYSNSERWAELLGKQNGLGNYTVPRFYNEVLGESYDLGTKLLTKTDLEEASILPWENKTPPPREILNKRKDYMLRVLGIDWGGGGEDEVSFTVMAVLGLLPGGKIDVIYGRKLLTPNDHMAEAVEVLRTFNSFDCHMMAHDYNGSGVLRETIMCQAGLPYNKIVPIVYRPGAMRNIVTYHSSETDHARNYWLVDKPRSLQLTCQSIRQKQIRLFKHDFVSEENRGLQHDFLALMENKVEMARGPDLYAIQRNPHFPDDFAHAVNYAAVTIWHTEGKYPNFAKLAGMKVSADQLQQIDPKMPWQGEGFFRQP